MSWIVDALWAPFADFAFMQRALLGAAALAVSCAPLGVFLIFRRMSLMGDAVAHGVLPGVAAGFMIAGLSLPAMALGGLLAGITVAGAAWLVARLTPQREETSLASLYLGALSLGVILVSAQGAKLDLLHILFGSALAVDGPALRLLLCCSAITLGAMALIGRALSLETLDPGFSASQGRLGAIAQGFFLILVVANLVAAFQAMGTLMGVGLLILPAAAARFWAGGLKGLIVAAAAIGVLAAFGGLLLSFHLGAPSGPAIVGVAALAWMGSLLLGGEGGLITRLRPSLAREARSA